jgi:hypothetical protein
LKISTGKYCFLISIAATAVLFLICSCSESTRQYREPRINYDSLAASIPKSDTLTFIPHEISDTSTEFHYVITCKYPELIHYDIDTVKFKINYAITGRLNEIIDLFKIDQKFLANDSVGLAPLKDLEGFETRQNYLLIDYGIVNNSRTIMSMIFNIEQYNAFSAHPISYHKTLNFDMKTGDEIDLMEFVQDDDSTFIGNLSNISYELISAKNISDSVWIWNGILPEWENFQNYNITRDSLILTFDVYQVAPYAVGPVRIAVPWEKLIMEKK